MEARQGDAARSCEEKGVYKLEDGGITSVRVKIFIFSQKIYFGATFDKSQQPSKCK